MKYAFIILAHRLPEQLVRLVQKLNDVDASFFIHVNKKTDAPTYDRMARPLSGYRNVYFLKRRRCAWGDFGTVRATLDGIQMLLATANECEYVNLLTGQDYPIKSNEQIQKALRAGGHGSFAEYFPLPSARWLNENGGLDRLEYWHFNLRGRRVALRKRVPFRSRVLNRIWSDFAGVPPLRRPLPSGMPMFGGSAFWCLRHECIRYVNEFVQRNPAFVKFFEHVFAPDEIFFQTIILNSPYATHITNDNLRYIAWSDSPHPAILRKHDFPQLMKSAKLFARKFDTTIDGEVLDLIDQATL